MDFHFKIESTLGGRKNSWGLGGSHDFGFNKLSQRVNSKLGLSYQVNMCNVEVVNSYTIAACKARAAHITDKAWYLMGIYTFKTIQNTFKNMKNGCEAKPTPSTYAVSSASSREIKRVKSDETVNRGLKHAYLVIQHLSSPTQKET